MPRVTPERTKRIQVDGMKCAACKDKVEQTLRKLAGVEAVDVDLESGIATVAGEVEPEDLIHALSSTDYQARRLTEHGSL